MKIILAIVLLVSANVCNSQINTFFVQPNETDINYVAGQDSSLVVRNTSINLNKLFLFIGGTGSHSSQYQTISNFAGNLGFDVINLSYPNTVAAASLGTSSDSLIFNKYRQEICFGTPVSSDVTVDTLNSIYTRTVKLISYLDVTYPTQNWGQYLVDPTTPDWSKIIVGGHSQGSGHACYLGKSNAVERVLMFAGPNDYSTYYSNSANWLRTPGVTSMNRHYTYLSLLDEVVPFERQLTNQEGLGVYPLYDTTYVDDSSSSFSNSHSLYTTQSPGIAILYHNTPIKFSFINNDVWTYMLTSPIVVGIEDIHNVTRFKVYPNPTVSKVQIHSDQEVLGKEYFVSNSKGKTILKGKITSKKTSLDFSALENGIYIINIDSEAVRIVKY